MPRLCHRRTSLRRLIFYKQIAIFYAFDRKLSLRVVYFTLETRLKLNTNEFPSFLVLVSGVNIANEKMQFEEEKDRVDSDRTFPSIVVRDRIAVGGRREKRFLLGFNRENELFRIFPRWVPTGARVGPRRLK